MVVPVGDGFVVNIDSGVDGGGEVINGGKPPLWRVVLELRVAVNEGITGVEVRFPKQSSELPRLTVITGVPLTLPMESTRRITTPIPAGIVTISQVYEVPLMSVKAAITGPLALPSWKD